jgi:hypothetical protein
MPIKPKAGLTYKSWSLAAALGLTKKYDQCHEYGQDLEMLF